MAPRPGKAKKAAKQRNAAKHRARRAKRRLAAKHPSPLDSLNALGEPSEAAKEAFRFCRKHELAPLTVLEMLVADSPTGTWKLKSGEDVHAVDTAARDELIRRLSAVVFNFKFGPQDAAAKQPVEGRDRQQRDTAPDVAVVPTTNPDDIPPCL